MNLQIIDQIQDLRDSIMAFFKNMQAAGSMQRDGFMLSGSGALRFMMIYEQELQEERQSLWLRINESIKKFKDHDKIN